MDAIQPEDKRRAQLANEVCKRHRAYIAELLERWRSLAPASREDIVQEVLLVLGAEVVRTGGEPEKVRGFLKRTVHKKVANHRKRWRPGGEEVASELPATSTEADPEGTAELHERLRKVERYCADLPAPWMEAVRCVCGAGMSVDEAAEALGRPRSTVHDQIKAVAAKLREREQDSERAAAERAGRPR